MSKTLDVIWYDSFANEYCVPTGEELNTAPPERYLKTVKSSSDDIYIEHWACSGSPLGNRIDVACPAYRYYDKRIGIWEERSHVEKMHNVTLQYILWLEIPPTLFDKYVKRFRLKGE